MGLLTGDIANRIFTGFKGKLLSGELRREVYSGGLDGFGDPVSATIQYFGIEGFTDLFTDFFNPIIPETDLKVSIFAKSSPGLTPEKNDKVIFLGTWYQLRQVGVDPAGALYECQAFEIEPPIDAS